MCNDWLPKCDFRAPKEPLYYDTSAGACAACGLIELAKILPEYERKLYLNAAFNILRAIEENFADLSEDTDFIIDKATTAYQYEHNTHLIYTDYYFVEALYKLKGFEILFW